MKSNLHKLLSCTLLAIMIAVFGYGLLRFSDGPISLRQDGTYKGKQNQIHTKEDFEHFTNWQNTFFLLWPIGMLVLFLLNKEALSKRNPFSSAK